MNDWIWVTVHVMLLCLVGIWWWWSVGRWDREWHAMIQKLAAIESDTERAACALALYGLRWNGIPIWDVLEVAENLRAERIERVVEGW